MIKKHHSRGLDKFIISRMTIKLAQSRYFYGLYLSIVVLSLCLLVEYVCQRIHYSNGLKIPFLIGTVHSIQKSFRPEDFNVLDPHLGYAHGNSEKKVQEFKLRHTWKRGFAIYSKKPLNQLERPIILALGGSTTDPIQYDHSWPEELAKILKDKGLPGTVINGGTGGYSTNQELIKLIRDGIEFAPDVVISYSGINDRGTYGRLPNPMVHKYQREVISELVKRKPPPLLPSTILLLQDYVTSKEGAVVGFTLGVDTLRSLGKWYERNLALMEAVARTSGAEFFAVLQPNAYIGDYEWGADYEKQRGKSAQYIKAVRRLYAEIIDLPKRVDYVYDFTKIFSGVKDAYIQDGVHATLNGNKIVAEHMLNLIVPELLPSSRKSSHRHGAERGLSAHGLQ